MSEVTKASLEASLRQLRCPFTWHLFKEESCTENLEEKISEAIGFLCPHSKASGYNLLAYLKHLKGHNEEALLCLEQAEKLSHQEHPEQAEVRNLVTWGNYAWLYYHMNRLEDSQAYLDKVAQTCRKFASPYRIDCPEMDCEEGWIRLKCGKHNSERAKALFESALEEQPDNLELRVGLATAAFCQDGFKGSIRYHPPDLLRQAIELDPDNDYLKVIMAWKLQRMGNVVEGEKFVEEALRDTKSPDILRLAAKFYRNQGCLEKALDLFKKALEIQPTTISLYHQIGCCYRSLASQLLFKEEKGDLQDPELNKKVRQLRECAVEYLEKAIELNSFYSNWYLDLAKLYAVLGKKGKAEAIFQKVFRMEQLTVHESQKLHQSYGNFQDYFLGQQDTAIHHFLEGLKITPQRTLEGEKMKSSLQALADSQLYYNPSSVKAFQVLGFLAKLNKDESLAVEYYEKALSILLKDSTLGLEGLFSSPSSSQAEASHEDRDGYLDKDKPPSPHPSTSVSSVLNGEDEED